MDKKVLTDEQRVADLRYRVQKTLEVFVAGDADDFGIELMSDMMWYMNNSQLKDKPGSESKIITFS